MKVEEKKEEPKIDLKPYEDKIAKLEEDNSKLTIEVSDLKQKIKDTGAAKSNLEG